MIRLLGDIHGDANALYGAVQRAKRDGDSQVIQLGDLGMFDSNAKHFRQVIDESEVDVFFIDGNHDDHERWSQYTALTPVAFGARGAKMYYVPRGTVLELDDRRIAFMGGAGSIDEGYRRARGIQFDSRENINRKDVERFLTNVFRRKIDLFLTHCQPLSIVESHFSPMGKLAFGVSEFWTDENMMILESLWDRMNVSPILLGMGSNPQKPFNYSGHMHKAVTGSNYRILNIDEEVRV
jgi:predicted phosphodiesterase